MNNDMRTGAMVWRSDTSSNMKSHVRFCEPDVCCSVDLQEVVCGLDKYINVEVSQVHFLVEII